MAMIRTGTIVGQKSKHLALAIKTRCSFARGQKEIYIVNRGRGCFITHGNRAKGYEGGLILVAKTQLTTCTRSLQKNWMMLADTEHFPPETREPLKAHAKKQNTVESVLESRNPSRSDPCSRPGLTHTLDTHRSAKPPACLQTTSHLSECAES